MTTYIRNNSYYMHKENIWGSDFFCAHLYKEGSLFNVSMLTCCSTRLYSRMGREVKLML